MSASDEYVSLVASLPSSERLFVAKLPPISRLKLSQRLKQLSQKDQKILNDVESVLDWRKQQAHLPEQQVVKTANKILDTLPNGTLSRLVLDKLELRTCIAALRKRRRDQVAPTDKQWGIGRWVDHINRHWNEPHFALEKVFPWLPEAKRLIDNNDAEQLERFILDKSFKLLQRYDTQHHFDLEAVIIYVLKWDIIERSTRYNTEAARLRFSKLVQEGLQNFREPLIATETQGNLDRVNLGE